MAYRWRNLDMGFAVGHLLRGPARALTSLGAVEPQSPSLRVLLIEDSALLAARLIELVNRHVLELHLREGSGFGVLRSLALSTRPRAKIIVLTNFGLPEYRREAESFGVEAFLDKAREHFRLPSLLTGFAKEHAVQDPH